jgi:hypothetical protein
VRLFSIACDSASITSVVSKWQLSSFTYIFNRGNSKVELVGYNSHVVFGQKFPAEKGRVRRSIVVLQEPCFVTKIRGKVFAHFQAITEKVQYYAELTVWPARPNSLRAIHLM